MGGCCAFSRRTGLLQTAKTLALLFLAVLCYIPLVGLLQLGGHDLARIIRYQDLSSCATLNNASASLEAEALFEFESVEDLPQDPPPPSRPVREKSVAESSPGADMVYRWLRHMDAMSDEMALCGTWQKEYATLHDSIRKGITESWNLVPTGERRYAVFYSNSDKLEAGGLGDRLVGMATVLMFALATKRAFVLYWPGVEDVFEPGGVDWTYNAEAHKDEFPRGFPDGLNWRALPKGVMRTQGGTREMPDFAFANLMNVGLDHPSLSLAWLENKTDAARVVVLRTNRGKLSNFLESSFQLQSSGLIQPHATGCLLRFLLRPTPTVVKAVAPVAQRLLAPGTFRIAIHTRLGDHWFNDTTPPDKPSLPSSPSPALNIDHLLLTVKPMLECAHMLASYWMPPNRTIAMFYASELEPLKVALKELLPDRVLVKEGKTAHINKPDGLVSSIAEWYLLSMCDIFVISRSGMSRTAAFYGGGEKKVFQFPRDLGRTNMRAKDEDDIKASIAALKYNDTSPSLFQKVDDKWVQRYCVPWRPFTLQELQEDWSGMR